VDHGAKVPLETAMRPPSRPPAWSNQRRSAPGSRCATYMGLRGMPAETLRPEPLLRTSVAGVNGLEDAFIHGS
jgi:hypothetical protein